MLFVSLTFSVDGDLDASPRAGSSSSQPISTRPAKNTGVCLQTERSKTHNRRRTSSSKQLPQRCKSKYSRFLTFSPIKITHTFLSLSQIVHKLKIQKRRRVTSRERYLIARRRMRVPPIHFKAMSLVSH